MGISSEAALNKTVEYAKIHSLRFRYIKSSLEEIRNAIETLSTEEQGTLYNIYSKDNFLFNFSSFITEEDNRILKIIHQKLGSKLNENATKNDSKKTVVAPKTFILKEKQQEEVKKEVVQEKVVIESPQKESVKEEITKIPEKKVEETIETKEEKKSIIETYSREDLLYAVPLLSKISQLSIYLRHNRNLNEDLKWENMKYEEEVVLAYHKKNYEKSYEYIDKILQEREALKENLQRLVLSKLGNYKLNTVLEAIQTLLKEEQTAIFLKHGKDLTEYNQLPRPYLEIYSIAIEHLREKLKDVEQKSTQDRKNARKNHKNILEEVGREKLLQVIPILKEEYKEVLYIRHGKNLDTTLEWPPAPKDKKANYYMYTYYNACTRIHTLLSKIGKNSIKKQIVKKIKKSNTKNILEEVVQEKKEQIGRIVAFIKNWKELKEQKEELEKVKENNFKIKLYNEFYALYREVISEKELKHIIEENISVEYECQIKIETAILVILANKYKANPDSEEALNILIRISEIFTREMEARYPLMKKTKIESAIESVLNTYTEEKIFSIELIKKLLK